MPDHPEVIPGDRIKIPWGVDEVEGTVDEVYGPVHLRRVVVRLTPELSDYVVDEPTTVVFPLEAIRKVAPTG